jgi:anti-sigma factor RsiW
MEGLIHGYLDGELGLTRSIAIEEHIEGCSSCRQTYQQQQALKTAVRSNASYYNAPAGLRKRVRAAVRNESGWSPFRVRAPWRLLGVAVSFAVVLAFVWNFWGAGPRSSEDALAQEIFQSHVRSLLANHLADVPSSDQHTVKPWFNGKIDFSPVVKDMAAEGFPLIGGRLDYIHNREVAALVYQRRQHVINLFTWPLSGESEGMQGTVTRQGYNVISWNKAGMTYWAISDLNSGELAEFVRMVQN